MDGDGNLDLFWVTHTAQHLFRGAGGKFIEVTQQSGALAAKFTGTPVGAVAGDFDNDGKADLFVIRDGSLSLYHNDGGGKFSDVTGRRHSRLSFSAIIGGFRGSGPRWRSRHLHRRTRRSFQPPRARQRQFSPDDFAGAPNLLLRNDGNGKFTDVTSGCKIEFSGTRGCRDTDRF